VINAVKRAGVRIIGYDAISTGEKEQASDDAKPAKAPCPEGNHENREGGDKK